MSEIKVWKQLLDVDINKTTNESRFLWDSRISSQTEIEELI